MRRSTVLSVSRRVVLFGTAVFCLLWIGGDRWHIAAGRSGGSKSYSVSVRRGSIAFNRSVPFADSLGPVSPEWWAKLNMAQTPDWLDSPHASGFCFCGDGRLYALDPSSGKVLWKILVGPPVQELRGFAPTIVAPPTVDNEKGVVYVSLESDWETATSNRHPVIAIDLRTREVRWRFNEDGFNGTFGAVVIDGDVLYVACSENGLYAIDRETGKLLWHDELDGNSLARSSPVVMEGRIYVTLVDAVYVFATGRTRHRLGAFDLGDIVDGSPFRGDGCLYVSARQHVWALKPPG